MAAEIVKEPENSDYTSIKTRIAHVGRKGKTALHCSRQRAKALSRQAKPLQVVWKTMKDLAAIGMAINNTQRSKGDEIAARYFILNKEIGGEQFAAPCVVIGALEIVCIGDSV